MKKALVVGCGLSGSVIARELAESGFEVQILERRNHIGGNMYDYIDEHGILIHKYGPHTFHTKKKSLYDYICRFDQWDEFHLTCGAEINGKCTPTPFNYKTIDEYYSKKDAAELKKEIESEFREKKTATVVEALNSKNNKIQEYARFLFDNDYSLYTAKQWGISPAEIDPSVLARVPLRFSYEEGYFDDEYQVMPHVSYTHFFNNLLTHKNITIELNINALSRLNIKDGKIFYNQKSIDYPVIFTGPIDELFNHQFEKLPYRSLRFEWHYEPIDSKQQYPVVAYPQATDFIRIIEYKKLPIQIVNGTTYEKEYSIPYAPGLENEPYYPVLTNDSQKQYSLYLNLSKTVPNLWVCGRLGDFKYYNMDQALECAINTSKRIVSNFK